MANIFRDLTLAALILVFPAALRADFTQSNVTLASGQTLNLETGAISTSGGDIQFNGANITFVGKASGYVVGDKLAAGGYALIVEATLKALYPGVYTQTPITGADLAIDTVFAVYDNSQHFAKVLIVAISNSSITVEFLTYGATGGAPAGAPVITKVQNNYSNVAAGLPNYGIAPSTIFVIYGTELANPAAKAVLQSSASPGIPTTLNGASISVTVNGITTHPAMYYAIATQIAAVLPANTPVGTGTLTVTYNGLTSAAFTMEVVASALGLDTLNGLPSGVAVATNGAGKVFYYTTSASPNQIITLWGSGLGADPADSDTVFTNSPHAVNVGLVIYIGGIQAQIQYAGSSGYPGLVQINVKVPPNVVPGCAVPVIGVVGTFMSNTVTIPVAGGGGVCPDPVHGTDGNGQLSAGKASNYKSATLTVVLDTTQKGNQSSFAGATFLHDQNQPNLYGYGYVTEGGCLTQQFSLQQRPNLSGTITYLNAGNLSIKGPAGTQAMQLVNSGNTLTYSVNLPSGFFPASGGTFTFEGSGGPDVGAFSVSVSDSSPLVWTNQAAITEVDRSQNLTVTWSGGMPGTWVQIGGGSTTISVSGTFVCIAPASAGRFTVPSYVLLASPVGNGGISLINQNSNQNMPLPGIDYPNVIAETESSISVPFK
ncbi:MAG TPA: hypothetical protein VJN43_05905 [Bryobacteraceae bacterium]|nr:hypothetical protein [Bryobacteraceae bacterium]